MDQKAQGKSPAYINSFVDTARLYGQFKGLKGLQKLRQFKVGVTQKATLSDDEIEAFLSLTARKKQPNRLFIKYRMFWHLVAFTGARPGEIAVLQRKHIDWGRGVLIFEMTKTNVPGVVPIPPNCKEMLEGYLEQLKTDYLFPSGNGERSKNQRGSLSVLTNVDWHYDFHKRLKQMGGIHRPKLTPYSFRHSMATRLLEENVSLFHVKKLMRHSDLKSTEVYSHLTTKDVIKAVQAHPLIRRGSDPAFILQGMSETIRKFNLDNDPRFRYSITQTERKLNLEIEIA